MWAVTAASDNRACMKEGPSQKKSYERIMVNTERHRERQKREREREPAGPQKDQRGERVSCLAFCADSVLSCLWVLCFR